MTTVQNINNIKYFTEKHEIIDMPFSFNIDWSLYNIKTKYHTLPTFIAEFENCDAHSLPLLVTEDKKLITNFVWPLISRYRDKPHKVHNIFKKWDEKVDITLPKIKKTFYNVNKYVWLPIDEYSAENPWHIWIDVISKFRLLELGKHKDFRDYVFIITNQSNYFDKVCELFFPNLRYYVMPKNETWRFHHLIVPSLSNHEDGILVPAMPTWLRKQSKNLTTSIPKRKIIISRKDATNRNITNHEQLFMALKSWETVVLDDLSIQEQVKLFSEATHIISPHGAGLINLLWCAQGTKVYELTHKDFLGKKVYPVLSKHLGLEHTVIVCETEKIKGPKPKNKKLKDMVNLKIDISKLLGLID
jgi:hypothetical protein